MGLYISFVDLSTRRNIEQTPKILLFPRPIQKMATMEILQKMGGKLTDFPLGP
jgi:hypothetical protein